MKLMQIKAGHTVQLETAIGMPEQYHVFDQKSIDAVNAALAAGRPLLVRGEPGTGKSQLARAAAKVLGREFVSHVVDSRTESRDLLWSFDAVSRLAEAQMLSALKEESQAARNRLAVDNFITPGPLWWAFDWRNAVEQAEKAGGAIYTGGDGGNPEAGFVVLVDEIDKAESDVPNGLLEALGAGQFKPLGRKDPIGSSDPIPLVIITTNEERRLPNAFLRRCLVLHLRLPESKKELIELLKQRGEAHFPQAGEALLHKAAEQLVDDREKAKQNRTTMPGQAEYLDLIRAVTQMAGEDRGQQDKIIETVAGFTLKKHAGGLV